MSFNKKENNTKNAMYALFALVVGALGVISLILSLVIHPSAPSGDGTKNPKNYYGKFVYNYLDIEISVTINSKNVRLHNFEYFFKNYTFDDRSFSYDYISAETCRTKYFPNYSYEENVIFVWLNKDDGQALPFRNISPHQIAYEDEVFYRVDENSNNNSNTSSGTTSNNVSSNNSSSGVISSTISSSSNVNSSSNSSVENDGKLGDRYVNGYFNADDLVLINSYIDFTIPVACERYDFIDESFYTGCPCLIFSFNYATTSDFNSYLSTMDQTFVYDSNTYDPETDFTYYFYSHGDWKLAVYYVESNQNFDFNYIELQVYNESIPELGAHIINKKLNKDLIEYFDAAVGFDIPCVGTHFVLGDFSEDYGTEAYIFNFNYVTSEDFKFYKYNLINNNFVFYESIKDEDENDILVYKKTDYYILVSFCENTELDYSYVYFAIIHKSYYE